jgi:hypothetical protein
MGDYSPLQRRETAECKDPKRIRFKEPIREGVGSEPPVHAQAWTCMEKRGMLESMHARSESFEGPPYRGN